MTDPIKAARREAIRATCRERCAEMGEPPCYEVTGDQGEELPWPPDTCNCADLFDAGAAAFLRALPAHLVEASPEGGLVAINAHNIAAAVERAAQEARE